MSKSYRKNTEENYVKCLTGVVYRLWTKLRGCFCYLIIFSSTCFTLPVLPMHCIFNQGNITEFYFIFMKSVLTQVVISNLLNHWHCAYFCVYKIYYIKLFLSIFYPSCLFSPFPITSKISLLSNISLPSSTCKLTFHNYWKHFQRNSEKSQSIIMRAEFLFLDFRSNMRIHTQRCNV